MLEGNARDLAHKISVDTARMLNDYMAAKIKRVAPKQGVPDAGIAAGYVYMAMLGGTVSVISSVISSVIEAVAGKNPDLAQQLREKIIKNVTEAGTQ